MAAPTNKFTDEQIAYFKCNRYVRNVGRSFVYFNDNFKEQFWRMYREENLLPQEILLRLSVDYDMLGRKRVEGIVQNLKKKYADGIAAYGGTTSCRTNRRITRAVFPSVRFGLRVSRPACRRVASPLPVKSAKIIKQNLRRII